MSVLSPNGRMVVRLAIIAPLVSWPAAVIAATEKAAGEAREKVFPPFEPSSFASQLLWLAITFGFFYYLMAKIALPRISSILEVRSDRIAQDLDEANRLKDESDAALAAYEQDLAEAKNRAHAIAQEARDEAKASIDAKRESVEADLGGKIAESEKHIADIKSKAMGEVGTIAQETAEALLGQLIGGKATKAEISKAISGAKG